MLPHRSLATTTPAQSTPRKFTYEDFSDPQGPADRSSGVPRALPSPQSLQCLLLQIPSGQPIWGRLKPAEGLLPRRHRWPPGPGRPRCTMPASMGVPRAIRSEAARSRGIHAGRCPAGRRGRVQREEASERWQPGAPGVRHRERRALRQRFSVGQRGERGAGPLHPLRLWERLQPRQTREPRVGHREGRARRGQVPQHLEHAVSDHHGLHGSRAHPKLSPRRPEGEGLDGVVGGHQSWGAHRRPVCWPVVQTEDTPPADEEEPDSEHAEPNASQTPGPLLPSTPLV
jgi:hypothetical protein